MYTPRYIEDTILKTHQTFKILYLGGPRQVGKTTVLLHLAKTFKFNYVTLDDLTARRLAKTDPELFLQQYARPLFIDEAQYAPELFPYLKLYADQSNQNGQYWLTGSQQFSVLKNVRESLAGRVGILNLLGFSLAEIQKQPQEKLPFLPTRKTPATKHLTIQQIFNFIFTGFFPIFYGKNQPQYETFYNSYLQTYLDRDLNDIFQITKLAEFHTFLQLCAARTGQMLNFSDLARDSAISVNAAREWINILESTRQIYLLRPYYKNISKRLIKAPKLYFLDTGLAAWLTRWKTPETLMSGAMSGAFFETFVISEIVKSYLFRGQEPALYYFRDKEHHEVDLLIEENGMIYPIEVKLASNINGADFKGISYIRNKFDNIADGAVISVSKQEYPFDRHNKIIPVSFVS